MATPNGLPALPSFLPSRPAVAAASPSSNGPPRSQPPRPYAPPRTTPNPAMSFAQPQPQAPQMSLGMSMPMPYGTIPYQTGYGYPQAIPVPYYQVPHAALRQTFFQQPVYSAYNESGYAYSQAYTNGQAQPVLQAPPPHAEPEAAYNPSQPSAAHNGRNGYPSYTNPSNTRDRPPPSSSAPPFKKPRIQAPPNFSEGSGGSWRNCVQAGCSFLGPEKEVEIHEEDRHLIFKEGRTVIRSEEEEEMAQLRKAGIPPPPIQGTSITLRTEEDIAKWIAQRKARFPTSARIAEKEKERLERIERGEPDAGFGARGRGRGRGRGGVVGGRGGYSGEGARVYGDGYTADSGYTGRDGPVQSHGETKVFGNMEWIRPGHTPKRVVKVRPQTTQIEEEQQAASDESDTEDEAIVSEGGEQAPLRSKGDDKLTLAGLKALLPDYGSDEDDDGEDGEKEAEMDGSEDEEEKQTEPAADSREKTSSTARTVNAARRPGPEVPICKYYARSGRCVHGDDCRYQHVRPERPPKKEGQSLEKQDRPRQPNEPKQVKVIGAFQKQVSRPSLLGALLQQPISASLSHLTQAIQFLVENDFLENVELVPGQAEEEESRQELVVVVEPEDVVETAAHT